MKLQMPKYLQLVFCMTHERAVFIAATKVVFGRKVAWKFCVRNFVLSNSVMLTRWFTSNNASEYAVEF